MVGILKLSASENLKKQSKLQTMLNGISIPALAARDAPEKLVKLADLRVSSLRDELKPVMWKDK